MLLEPEGNQLSGLEYPAQLKPLLFDGFDENNPKLRRLRAQQFNTNWGEAGWFSVAGTAVSAFDTIVESLGIVDQDGVEEYMADNYPEFGNFFLRHRDRFSVAGDIAGTFLLGGVGAGLVRSSGLIGRGMTRVFGDKVTPFLSTGKSARELTEQAVARAHLLQNTRKTGILPQPEALRKIAGQVRGRRTADFLIEALAAESTIVGGMHGSEFLFPEEMSATENVIWALGTNAVIGMGFWWHGAWAANRIMQKTFGPLKKEGTNPADLPEVDLGRHDGTTMAVRGQLINALKEQSIELQGETDAAAANATRITAQREAVTNTAQQAMKRTPLEGLNESGELTPGGARNITAQVEENPEIFHALQSLEVEDSLTGRTAVGRAEQLRRADNKLFDEEAQLLNRYDDIVAQAEGKLQAQIAAIPGATSKSYTWEDFLTPQQQKFMDGLDEKLELVRNQRDQLKRMVPVTFELDGKATLGAQRAAMFQDGERHITRAPRGEGEEGATFRAVVGEGTEGDSTVSGAARATLEADAAGRVKTPSRHCPISTAGRMAVQGGVLAGHGSLAGILAAQGMDSLDELRAAAASGVPYKWGDNPEVQWLREYDAIPEQFVGYRKGDNTSELQLAPGDGYTNATVVRRENLIAVSDDGTRVFADTPEFAPLNSGTWNTLDHRSKTAVWDLLQRQIEEGGNAWDVLREASRATHHTQLDYIAEKAVKAGIPAENADYASMHFRSLESKFNDFQVMRENADAHELLMKDHEYLMSHKHNIARALNLDEESGILELFEQLRVEGEIVRLSDEHDGMDSIMRTLAKRVGIDDTVPVPQQHFRGNMLHLDRKRGLVGGYVDSAITLDGDVREALTVAVAQQKSAWVEFLRQHPESQVVKTVIEHTVNNPEMMATIKQGVQQLVQGLQNYGPVSRQVFQQHFLLRDQPGAEPMDTAIANFGKIMEKATQRAFQKETEWERAPARRNIFRRRQENITGPAKLTRQEVLNDLLLPNAKSAAGLEMFHVFAAMRAQGWDIGEDSVRQTALPSGEVGYRFVIGDSTKNRELFELQYREPGAPLRHQQTIDADMEIPVPGKPGIPLTIPENTYRAVKAAGSIMEDLLVEVNALREADGLKPIKKKSFWLPPAVLRGKELRYLVNEAGQVVRIVSDATEKGVAAKAAKEVENASKRGHMLTSLTQGTVENYRHSFLESVFNLEDYSYSGRQTGASEGKTAATVFARGAAPYKEMQETMLRAWSDLGRQVNYAVFEPELQYLKVEHAATGAGEGDETIFSFVAKRVAGTQNLDANTIVGKGLLYAGNAYDEVVSRATNALIRGEGRRDRARAAKTQQNLERHLGKEFTPFEDTNDYLERTHKVVIPGTLRKHAGALGYATATSALRFMDLGMAVVNLGSLAVTMPPVVRMAFPRRGETDDLWRERVSAFGGVTPGGNPWLDPVKIMARGLRWSYTEEARAIRELANARGYFDQFAAEGLGMYDKAGQGFIEHVAKKWIDVLSVPTDWSERQARAISFMSFFHLGREGFGLKDEAAMVFAHKQANNTIADFRPSNRPTIFQGSAGMPLSLFTTYMWNFLQRIYRVVETGDARTAAVQFGLQTSLFGVNSLPGAQAYIQSWGANEDGTLNVEDRIADVIGRGAADVLMHGSVSTFIPRALGLGGGIDIGSRAGIGLPFSRVITGDIIGEPSSVFENLWKVAPGLQFAGRLWDTGQKAIDRVLTEGGFEFQDAAEILAASNINKGMSNILEIAQGYAVDHADQKIEENTRNRIGVAARLAGFKPLKTTQTQAEMRRIQNTKRIQNAMKQKLSDWMRVELRKGTLTSDRVDEALGDYVKAGGSSRNFRNWFLSQVRKGTRNKLDLALAEAVRANDADARVARLLFMMQDEY